MKRFLIAAIMIVAAAYSAATDLATATAQDEGTIILTNVKCQDSAPYKDVNILQIRHVAKSGKITSGCYIATEAGIQAIFENGALADYQITDFKWTPEAIQLLSKKEKKLYI